jgi:hypothetical protein
MKRAIFEISARPAGGTATAARASVQDQAGTGNVRLERLTRPVALLSLQAGAYEIAI